MGGALIVDTGALLAWFGDDQRWGPSVASVIRETRDPLVVSPYVLAELDYFLLTRVGVSAELAALRELSGGAWTLPSLNESDVAAAAEVIDRYGDQGIGLADASLVVLAQRYQTDRILTLDRRHFSVLRQHDGRPFTLVPEARST